MLFGVAAVVTATIVSALAAILFDLAYQAVVQRRWGAALPPVAVLVAFVALVMGAVHASSS